MHPGARTLGLGAGMRAGPGDRRGSRVPCGGAGVDAVRQFPGGDLLRSKALRRLGVFSMWRSQRFIRWNHGHQRSVLNVC